jgi:hypothetical protein
MYWKSDDFNKFPHFLIDLVIVEHRIGGILTCSLEGASIKVPVKLLGTRFTNAISCFEPSPQECYRKFFETL